MRAASLTGRRSVAVCDVEPPLPGPGEVLVRVRACGICGSDLHRYRAGGTSGATPGHEFAGAVAALGPEVTGWDAGAPVVVEPVVACRSCDRCRRGDYQLCGAWGLIGGGRLPGGMAEYARVPAYTLFPIPDGLPFPTAALAEPVAVAVHGLRLVAVRPGERVLVLGSGTIGLVTALAARERGAAVTATARYPHQAAAAERCGAARVVPADEAGGRELAALAAVDPFDVVVETVGGEAATLAQATSLVRPGGRVCVLGIFFRPPSLGALALVLREVRMVGAITYGREGGLDAPADFDRALALLTRHRDTAASLVTHRLPLDAVAEAFRIADDKSSQALKVMVEP